MGPAEIGLGLTAFGVLFGLVGIIFFFDRGLIAMGNVGNRAKACASSPASPGVGLELPVRVCA